MIGSLARRDVAVGTRAAWLKGRLMADDLLPIGITINCAPVLDAIIPGASEAIGDRSFGGDPDLVTALGRAVAEGLLAGGVIPAVKHAPGQGRALVDSHYALPVVEADLATLEATDFRPFRALSGLLVGDYQPYGIHSYRRRSAGHDLGDPDLRYHPRANRFRRCSVQR